MVSKALQVAQEALAGMQDEYGNPYLDHSLRIMEKMETDEEKIVALLHDVVEDTEISLNDLQGYGFSRTILDTVGQLTKRTDMTYFDYIDDVSCSDVASKVKIAELEDNKDVFRVKKMSFQTYSLDERCKRALAILKRENSDANYK